MAWTQEQQQAITLEGMNIIVSAGAGSGKTAVLSERVLRKVKSGIHVNSLLVLTFTNAAAAEMKDRIRSNIAEVTGLEEELALVDNAYITTFDSFSLSIVKKYHTKLNISEKIAITDEVIIDLEKDHLLETIFSENYLSPQKNFLKLINDFCFKDDQELKQYLLNVYKKIDLKYDKEAFLTNYIDTYYTEDNINSFIDEYLKEITASISILKNLVIDLEQYFDADYINKVKDQFNPLFTAKTYEEIKNSLSISLPRLPNKSPSEGKKIKNDISKILSKIMEMAIYNNTTEMYEEILATKNNSLEIIRLIKELDKRLTNLKTEHEYYNFNDIARLAIKVVAENEDVKEELKNSFNEILIDEYQDTSDIQEKFISLIANNNVYMVGDIKQSIYRFRNANPYIFKNKYDTYRDTDLGIKIDLLKNFRSRNEVLNNINMLFDYFMDDDIGGANYHYDHQMVFGNDLYTSMVSDQQNYNLELLTYSKDLGKISKDEEEAFIIGNDILNKINNNYQVFDKNTKTLRQATYNDFVILLDKSKSFTLYKKIFEYLHIPMTILKDEELRKDYDILVIKNLLKLLICIKNKDFSLEFKYSYIALCRSFLFKTSDEKIYEIYTTNSYQETPLYQKCLNLLEKIDVMGPAEYLDYLLDEFNYDEKILTIGNVSSYRTRREYFYNLINNFSTMGKTIYDFVSYLEELLENDYDIKFNVNTNTNDSVKIMTIHKSKGLEYPICYFASFTNEFNISELKERIIYDNKYGLVLPLVNNYYKDTIIKTLLKINTKKEEISEKIRLLYVAVTRAREKMLIVMPEVEEEFERRSLVPSYERLKYNSFYAIMKSIYSLLLPYETKVNVPVTKDYLKITSQEALINTKQLVEVQELNILNTTIEEEHYSKDSLHLITKEEKDLLHFGEEVHALLEEIDFKKPDFTKFNVNSKIIAKVKTFLASDLIKENLNNKMYKEYEFIYHEEKTISHGIIDLLIETPEKMLIIDYKLKNITDPLYSKQLNGYRKYIAEKTKKKTECYLYSIIDSYFQEVPNA